MRGKNAYQKVSVESGVASASPHRLILLLLDGCLSNITAAERHMTQGNKAMAGTHIGKAIAIINTGLRSSLDMSQGEISKSLDEIYNFCANHLLMANLKQNTSMLMDVSNTIDEIKSGWKEISTSG